MTRAQLPVITSNETPVLVYVEKIKKHIGDATHAWRQVAEVFASAADEFHFESDKMKSLMKQTGFSKSKASKLISIHKCKRLRECYSTFRMTNTWTVLYEITKLNDQEFEKLLGLVDGDEIVTQRLVNMSRTKKTTEPDPYKTVFSIQVDINALKSNSFSGNDYQELMEMIEEIQNRLNHIRIIETPEMENDAIQHLKELDREFDKVVRKEFVDAKKAYISKASVKDRFGRFTKDELNDLIKSKSFAEAFDAIDSDRFDQARLYSVAETNLSNTRRKKFVPKMRPHNEYANTSIQLAA